MLFFRMLVRLLLLPLLLQIQVVVVVQQRLHRVPALQQQLPIPLQRSIFGCSVHAAGLAHTSEDRCFSCMGLIEKARKPKLHYQLRTAASTRHLQRHSSLLQRRHSRSK